MSKEGAPADTMLKASFKLIIFWDKPANTFWYYPVISPWYPHRSMTGFIRLIPHVWISSRIMGRNPHPKIIIQSMSKTISLERKAWKIRHRTWQTPYKSLRSLEKILESSNFSQLLAASWASRSLASSSALRCRWSSASEAAARSVPATEAGQVAMIYWELADYHDPLRGGFFDTCKGWYMVLLAVCQQVPWQRGQCQPLRLGRLPWFIENLLITTTPWGVGFLIHARGDTWCSRCRTKGSSRGRSASKPRQAVARRSSKSRTFSAIFTPYVAWIRFRDGYQVWRFGELIGTWKIDENNWN